MAVRDYRNSNCARKNMVLTRILRLSGEDSEAMSGAGLALGLRLRNASEEKILCGIR